MKTTDSIDAIESKLPPAHKLSESGLSPQGLRLLFARIEQDVRDKKYPGAAVAFARHGRICARAEFGMARLAPHEKRADAKTLWLLYSQTKPIISTAILLLVERGLLSLHEPVATYLPNFARHGKNSVTVYHLLTHQAGFPNATVPHECWGDSDAIEAAVCDFKLEWTPGEKVFYHAGSSHWTQAVLIETVSRRDFRSFIHDQLLAPLALSEIYIGAPERQFHRLTENYECTADGAHRMTVDNIFADYNSPQFFTAGVPGAGGFATASNMAMFYQFWLGGGILNGTRVLSEATVAYARRNHTGERPDEFFGMPMHRGLGVHLRGSTPTIRGLGSTASADTFGHGGVGTSYSWANPQTGASFTYLTNSRLPEPYHTRRLDEIMTMAHACIEPA